VSYGTLLRIMKKINGPKWQSRTKLDKRKSSTNSLLKAILSILMESNLLKLYKKSSSILKELLCQRELLSHIKFTWKRTDWKSSRKISVLKRKQNKSVTKYGKNWLTNKKLSMSIFMRKMLRGMRNRSFKFNLKDSLSLKMEADLNDHKNNVFEQIWHKSLFYKNRSSMKLINLFEF